MNPVTDIGLYGYRHRFLRHLVYSVTCSAIPITSTLLTTLYSSVRTTLVYNDINYSVPFMTLQLSSTVFTLQSDVNLHALSGDTSRQSQTRRAVITSVTTEQFCYQTIAANLVTFVLWKHIYQYLHTEFWPLSSATVHPCDTSDTILSPQ
jgi:hypothetical protein